MFGKSKDTFLGTGQVTESLKVSITDPKELKQAIEGFIRMNRKIRKIHFWVTDIMPSSGDIEITFKGEKIRKRFWKKNKSPMRMTCFVTTPITELPDMEVSIKKKQLEKKFKRKFDMTVIFQHCKGTRGKILVVLLAEEIN